MFFYVIVKLSAPDCYDNDQFDASRICLISELFKSKKKMCLNKQ